MPGTQARQSARVVMDSLDVLPHLVELPARGPGADMVGRSLGLLVELYAHLEPSGWRFADRPGRDTRRAWAWLREDLDALEEFTQGYQGLLKLQAVGPWTLAAHVELRGGEAALGDPGACRDIAASLAEGLRRHVDEVRDRMPGATPILQLDEPSLTSVLGGRVPTASGYRVHHPVEQEVVEGTLRQIVESVGVPCLVHSCAPRVPVALLRRSGVVGVSLDFDLLTESDHDSLGEAVEAGMLLLAGVLPARDDTLSDPGGSVEGIRQFWHRLGLDPHALPRSVAVTPVCGLAGASPAYARAALAHCVRAARSLVNHPE